MKSTRITTSDEAIISKIFLVRGNKVMLDRDLAELYGVETKVLKQAVRRNKKRFPRDFMFEMSTEELQNWRSQFVTSNVDRMGLRYPPFCFTEHGILMLSSVLNSDYAVEINIQIIRIFTKMRSVLLAHKDILIEVDQIKQKLDEHDGSILLIFELLKQLEEEKQLLEEQHNRQKIGYKRYNEE